MANTENKKRFSLETVKRIFFEVSPLLLIYMIIELGAGGVFSRITDSLTELPGFLLLVPVLMAMRGHVSASYGARLSTAYHLGLITPKTGFNDEAMENAKASIILTLVSSTLAASLAYLITLILNMPNMGLINFLILSLGAGVTSGLIMISFSYFVAMTAARLSLDPNNVTAPTITTIGDIIIISTILVIAGLITSSGGGIL
jgi:mgtE-like transporter